MLEFIFFCFIIPTFSSSIIQNSPDIALVKLLEAFALVNILSFGKQKRLGAAQEEQSMQERMVLKAGAEPGFGYHCRSLILINLVRGMQKMVFP